MLVFKLENNIVKTENDVNGFPKSGKGSFPNPNFWHWMLRTLENAKKCLLHLVESVKIGKLSNRHKKSAAVLYYTITHVML